jgi:SAM-dependent methyltransferase
VDAAAWDAKYAATEQLWSVGPNTFVSAECGHLRPGTAVDLAAGEGRNALWLASLGWRVTAVDFSPVAIERGSRLPGADAVRWVVDDVTTWRAPSPVDLVVVAYLQLPAAELGAAVRSAVGALAPGGRLVWVAHDRSNVADGVGGPQDPSVLSTATEVAEHVAAAASDLGVAVELRRADTVERPVGDRVALDCLVVARRTGRT